MSDLKSPIGTIDPLMTETLPTEAATCANWPAAR